MAGRSNLNRVVGVAAGALAWTATEYASHRWVLHGPFGRGRLRRLPLGGLHRAHHRRPEHTVLPARAAGHLGVGAGAAIAATALGRLAPTIPAAVIRSAAGAFSLGYSTYEVNHWNLHHRAARTARGRLLRARHERHHHGAPASNLGVTVRFWDRLLGTESLPNHPHVA